MKRLPTIAATVILSSASFLLATPPMALAALPTLSTCPTPGATESAAYKAAFNFACHSGFDLAAYLPDDNDSSKLLMKNDSIGPTNGVRYLDGGSPSPNTGGYCNAFLNRPAIYDRNTQWVFGCNAGYAAGEAAHAENLALWPAKPKPIDLSKPCMSLAGYRAITEQAQARDFLNACTTSYKKAINQQRLADETTFRDFDDSGHFTSCGPEGSGSAHVRNGCLAGFSKAKDDFEAAFDLLPGASDEDIAFVSDQLSNCGLSLSGASDPISNQSNGGGIKGCITGYRAGFSGGTNTHGVEVTGFPRFDYRSAKHSWFKKFYIDGYEAGYAKGAQVRSNCRSDQESGVEGIDCGVELSGPNSIVPNCAPWLTPGKAGSCGLGAFAKLIQNVIRYLLMIMIPIAVLGLGYGGFKIMTAAGNPGKVEEGYQTMKTVVIGIVIALAAYLVVKFIFLALGVEQTVGNIF